MTIEIKNIKLEFILLVVMTIWVLVVYIQWFIKNPCLNFIIRVGLG